VLLPTPRLLATRPRWAIHRTATIPSRGVNLGPARTAVFTPAMFLLNPREMGDRLGSIPGDGPGSSPASPLNRSAPDVGSYVAPRLSLVDAVEHEYTAHRRTAVARRCISCSNRTGRNISSELLAVLVRTPVGDVPARHLPRPRHPGVAWHVPGEVGLAIKIRLRIFGKRACRECLDRILRSGDAERVSLQVVAISTPQRTSSRSHVRRHAAGEPRARAGSANGVDSVFATKIGRALDDLQMVR